MSTIRSKLRRIVHASMTGWWVDPREVDQRTDEIYDAIRAEERERCAAALVDHARRNRGMGFGLLHDGARLIRALPDEEVTAANAHEVAMRGNPEGRPVEACPVWIGHKPHPWDDLHGNPLHCTGEELP